MDERSVPLLSWESRGSTLTFEDGSIVAIIVATLSERAGEFHDRINGYDEEIW
jgi:hypothetical protein